MPDICMKEITPEHLRCGAGSCPAVFVVEETGEWVVVGKKLDPDIAKRLKEKIGEDETAVVIDPKLLPAQPGPSTP